MENLEKRWKRGIEKVIGEGGAGTEELKKAWRCAAGKKETVKGYYLEAEEVKHILRKLFHVPTHLGFEAELGIALKIMQKLGYGSIKGDPETISLEANDDK